MKKYNMHEIMSAAWALYRKWVAPYKYNNTRVPAMYSFANALKNAWTEAKCAAEKAAAGIVRMHYAQYKSEYANCKTVDGSYDKATKTIEVMTKVIRKVERAAYAASVQTRRVNVAAIRGLCPRCHTYCYGDCTAR